MAESFKDNIISAAASTFNDCSKRKPEGAKDYALGEEAQRAADNLDRLARETTVKDPVGLNVYMGALRECA